MKPLILLVEDDAQFAHLIEFSLKQTAFELHCVASGREALSWLENCSVLPEVILLDIDLDDMNGYDVCVQIQENPTWSVIPIVFISGQNYPDSRLKAFQAGAVGYLSKPVQQQELIEQLRKAQEVRQQWLQDFHASAPVPAVVTPAEVPLSPETQFLIPLPDQPSHYALAEPLPHPPEPKSLHASPSDFNQFVKYLAEHMHTEPDSTLTPDSFYLQTLQKGVSSEQLVNWIAEYTGLTILNGIRQDQLKLGVLPLPFCRRHQLVPFQDEQNHLSFLMTHPFTIEVFDALRRFQDVQRYLAPPDYLINLLEGKEKQTHTPPPSTGDIGELMDEVKSRYNYQQNLMLQREEEEELETADDIFISDTVNEAPLVRLVNRVIEEAYQQRASDIHIDPWEDCVMVRYRIDGELHDIYRLKPQALILPISARLKVMSRMNLAERRLPQDGRIVFKEYNSQFDFDLRVAIAPMNFGEKIVMRIIDKHKSTLPLDTLGFSERHLQIYRELVKSPYGMILHVGPTGSGKSMTLYSALNEINCPEINIQTAEDPIEYTLPRINQLQVHPEIGLTFARALRSYLRQDPDVILVGEIRDRETAHIAIEAALTGHLLLSTLHTNDAPTTLTRFLEMGVEPFMVSSSILIICAQRLVKTLCQDCREAYQPSALELKQLGVSELSQPIYRPGGCKKCQHSGYHGRTGVHELLVPSDRIRMALNTPGMNADELKKLAVAEGMTTLYWDAMDKVIQGRTSLAEALANVRPDDFDSRPVWWGTNFS